MELCTEKCLLSGSSNKAIEGDDVIAGETLATTVSVAVPADAMIRERYMREELNRVVNEVSASPRQTFLEKFPLSTSEDTDGSVAIDIKSLPQSNRTSVASLSR
jgi:hypothetical protein